MVVPVISDLPPAPTRNDGAADFTPKADAMIGALQPLVVQVNIATQWMNGTLSATQAAQAAAAASASAAANSATLAGDKLTLATTQANNAAASASSALTYAQAAGASAGIPTPVANRFLGTDAAGNPLWKSAGQQIGDILYTALAVGPEYKLADGSTYLQASYPDWVSKVGATPISPPAARQSAPGTTPTAIGPYQISWGAAGTYLVFGGNDVGSGTGPILQSYKRSADTLTKLTNLPTTAGAVTGTGLVLSADAVYAMGTNSGAPLVEFFKRSADTFTKLADPATLPTNVKTIDNNAACSADGVYWLFAGSTALTYYVYKRSGDVFTRIVSATLPAGTVINGLSISADGNYLGFALQATPFVSILKRTGDTFAAVAAPTSPPTAPQGSCAFSADATYFVSSGNAANYALTVLTRSVDAFTRTQQFTDPAANSTILNCSLSADGLNISYGTANGALMWRRTAELWAQITNFSGTGIGTTRSVAFANGSTYFNKYFAAIGATTPYLGLWRDAYPFDPLTEFQVPFVTTAANGVTTGNTNTNTKPPQVAAYVKVKEPV